MENTTTTEAATIAAYNASKKGHRARGGDLYIRPLASAEMVAPLEWFEEHMAVAVRFGVLSTGAIGYRRVNTSTRVVTERPL